MTRGKKVCKILKEIRQQIAVMLLIIATTFAACTTLQYGGYKQSNVTISKMERGENDAAEEELIMIVEKTPEYPGGDEARLKFIQDNFVYPEEAKEKQIEGTVYVGFTVEKDGSISDIKVLRGIGGGCDEEAVRIISMMPNWKPAQQRGKEVRVIYSMPIRFKLNDK